MMKKINFCVVFALLGAFLFSSCSKEEQEKSIEPVSQVSSISFATNLNNMDSRQALICADAVPAFVEIILSKDGVVIVGTENDPVRINLNPNPTDTNNDGIMDYFTEESALLELEPGTYTLEYFTVLDAEENVIWIAPMEMENIDGMYTHVPVALPMDIELGAGVKKYVKIDVLCFDDRIVNQYGYLFFELNEVQAIEFCIFGNYCYEDGRHAEFVAFTVDVWKYSGDPSSPAGEVLYSDLENEIIVTDYEDYAETAATPLCVALPDLSGLDQYYFEITMLNHEPANSIIRSGVITDADVRALFDGESNVEYYHFREGNCNLEDSPVLFQ